LATVVETESTTDSIESISPAGPVVKPPQKRQVSQQALREGHAKSLIRKTLYEEARSRERKAAANAIRNTLLNQTLPDVSPNSNASTDAALDKILGKTGGREGHPQALKQFFSEIEAEIENDMSLKKELSVRELLKQELHGLDKPDILPRRATTARRRPSTREARLLVPELKVGGQASLIRRTIIKSESAYNEKELQEIKVQNIERQKIEKMSIGVKTDDSLRHVFKSSTSGYELEGKSYRDDDLIVC